MTLTSFITRQPIPRGILSGAGVTAGTQQLSSDLGGSTYTVTPSQTAGSAGTPITISQTIVVENI